MRAKQRNDEIFNQRMRDKEQKMKMEEENRQKYFNNRVNHQMVKDKTLKAIHKAKNKEYKVGKSMTIQNDIYKKQFINEVRKKNQLKKLKIREEEELRAEKLKQLEEKKLKENQEFYSSRVDDEKQRILEKELKIREMEKMEAELLNRLKNSQQMEQSEYSQLEKALKDSNQACEERRKKQAFIRKPRPKELTKMRHSVSIHDSQSLSSQLNGKH